VVGTGLVRGRDARRDLLTALINVDESGESRARRANRVGRGRVRAMRTELGYRTRLVHGVLAVLGLGGLASRRPGSRRVGSR